MLKVIALISVDADAAGKFVKQQVSHLRSYLTQCTAVSQLLLMVNECLGASPPD